jgi:hypothetical protein
MNEGTVLSITDFVKRKIAASGTPSYPYRQKTKERRGIPIHFGKGLMRIRGFERRVLG